MKPVSVLCNMKCTYCYNKQLRSSSVNKMSSKLLEDFFRQLSELNDEKFRFIWHGGEPLIAGIDFYKTAVTFQSTYLKSQYCNKIQTNGTLITQEWASFFKENAFGVGVSLDGSKEIHDRYRVMLSGDGSFEKVMRGLAILRANGFDPGICSVVTKEVAQRADVMWNFFHRHQLRKIHFLGCAEKVNGRMTDFSVSSGEYADFMIEIFNQWIEEDDPNIKIRPLDSFFLSLIGGRPTVCCYSNNCATYLALDSNGDLYTCGRFVNHENFRIGNIKEQPLCNLLSSTKWENMKTKMSALDSRCKKCKWSAICNGGCSYYKNIDKYPNYFCNANQKILSHMKSFLSKEDFSLLAV